MKGIVIVSKFWTRVFSLGKARGVTVFPFIFLLFRVDKDDDILLNHERIHIRQAIETLVIPFYVWYFIEFIVRYCRLKDWNRAYRVISFEVEAYQKENDLQYLKNRAFWSFLNYINKK